MSVFQVCLKCEVPYQMYPNNPRHNQRQCSGCQGDLIEVDDLMVPIIFELNRKGYTTQFCCSGHVSTDRVQTYILLDDSVMKYVDIDKFRNGIDPQIKIYKVNSKDKRHVADNRYMVEYVGVNMGYPQRIRKVPEINQRLYEWACGLDYLKLTPEQEQDIKSTREKGLDFRGLLKRYG